jgi:hypothetical protein
LKTLDLCQLPHRMLLALLLAPVFWLVFLWVYYLSPQNRMMNMAEALAYMAALSYLCAYCVTLFIIALRDSRSRSKSDDGVRVLEMQHAQADQ